MSRGQFYLDKSNAKLAGVCSGIADYTGVDAFWVRLAAVLMMLFGFPVVIPIYIAIAVLADNRPMGLYTEEEETRLLQKMARRRSNKGLNLREPSQRSNRLRSELSDMDRRVSDMEAHYSNSNSRLAAEIENLR